MRDVEQRGAVHACRYLDVAVERDRVQRGNRREIDDPRLGEADIRRKGHRREVGHASSHRRLLEQDAMPAGPDRRIDARVATGKDGDPERHAVPSEDGFGFGHRRTGIPRLRRDEREVLSRIGEMREAYLEAIDIHDLSARDRKGLQSQRRRHRASEFVQIHQLIVPGRYAAPMPSPASILVDFDGTACLHDVAEHLLIRYGDASWPMWDEAWARGEVGARQGLTAQAAMLDAPTDELIAFALDHCPLDPTFAPFVDWARSIGSPVTLVSDGFGFYIRPLLQAHDVADVPVITNDWAGGAMTFPNGHGVCIGCGTCKMRAVLEAPGPVAFVGEGDSDRFGALYADIVFAKDALVGWCERDGVSFVAWKDFDDVRRRLETDLPLPGAVDPERCPGWRLP